MPNRLANATSPYLLQHMDNPVDWHEWGDEAFDEARRRDVPVLLSVGYAACHWCHVMAHESFEDSETAEEMNRLFVNIKVDREERPDVDSIYMEAVQAMSGQGGWPMTVWLDPEAKCRRRRLADSSPGRGVTRSRITEPAIRSPALSVTGLESVTGSSRAPVAPQEITRT